MDQEEYFYGATLDKAGASITWTYNEDEDEEQHVPRKLFVKQILLGHTAKEGEYNVVEVEALSTSDMLKIPLAVLKVGETRSVMANVEFPCPPVTFKLIEGNGPVYIHGNQVPVYVGTVEDEAIEEEQEEEQEEEIKPSSKKRKLGAETAAKATNGSSNNHKATKKPAK